MGGRRRGREKLGSENPGENLGHGGNKGRRQKGNFDEQARERGRGIKSENEFDSKIAGVRSSFFLSLLFRLLVFKRLRVCVCVQRTIRQWGTEERPKSLSFKRLC